MTIRLKAIQTTLISRELATNIKVIMNGVLIGGIVMTNITLTQLFCMHQFQAIADMSIAMYLIPNRRYGLILNIPPLLALYSGI